MTVATIAVSKWLAAKIYQTLDILGCPSISIYQAGNSKNVFYQFDNWLVSPVGSPIWRNVCLKPQCQLRSGARGTVELNALEHVPRFKLKI